MTGGSAVAPAWNVVLDANILLQAPVRDTILRLAEAERRGQRLFAALRRAFSEATVYGYEQLLPSLPIAPHDRHVLACAITASAQQISTYNTRHFPARHLAPYRIEAWHPDRLLNEILEQRPTEVLDVLLAQGEELHPPRSLAQVVAGLARDLPRFAAHARQRFRLG